MSLIFLALPWIESGERDAGSRRPTEERFLRQVGDRWQRRFGFTNRTTIRRPIPDMCPCCAEPQSPGRDDNPRYKLIHVDPIRPDKEWVLANFPFCRTCKRHIRLTIPSSVGSFGFLLDSSRSGAWRSCIFL